MKTIQRLFFLAATMLAAFAFAADAPSQEPPDVLVKRITREVLETARNDKAIRTGNRQRILQVVEEKILPHLDLERAMATATGPHWREATPEQRQRLTEEFTTMLLRTYAGALSLVDQQEVVFKPMRADAAAAEAEVRFEVLRVRGREPVAVSYRLHQSPDGWKVYDVNVLGVWMVETYKSSFTPVLSRDGIDGLIRTLAEHNRALAAQPRPSAG